MQVAGKTGALPPLRKAPAATGVVTLRHLCRVWERDLVYILRYLERKVLAEVRDVVKKLGPEVKPYLRSTLIQRITQKFQNVTLELSAACCLHAFNG